MNIYDKPAKEILAYLGKRVLMLAAKLVGFKACCLYLATALLAHGVITDEVWLYVVVAVICSASGLRIADVCTAGKIYGGRRPPYFKGAYNVYNEDDSETGFTSDCAHHDTGGNAENTVQSAVENGKKRIRALLAENRDADTAHGPATGAD